MNEPSHEVLVSRDDAGVCTIAFCRPQRKHAFTAKMYADVAHALRMADGDPTCGAVLLVGDDQAFSAGNDLEDFLHHPPTTREHPVFTFLETLVAVDVPMVAAVCGPAIGVGTTMLLHCDLVVAGKSAQLRLPFVDLGLCPEAGSSLLLSLAVGPRKAAELLLLGGSISGEEAARAGLVNRVEEDDAVIDTARALARELSAKPRDALRATKRLMRDSWRQAIRTAMEQEGGEFVTRLASPEAKAAFSAFLRRRRPST